MVYSYKNKPLFIIKNGLDEKIFMEASLSGTAGKQCNQGRPRVVFGVCLGLAATV